MTTPLKTASPTLVPTPRCPRKIRPLFSPVKPPKIQPPLRSAKSLEDLQAPKANLSNPASILPTSALDFDELIFEKDGHLDYDHATKEQQVALDAYLQEHYGGHVAISNPPFLVVECDHIPEEGSRPFSISGMAVIWLKKKSFEGFADLQIYMGQGEQGRLPDKVSAMLDGVRIPHDDVILYLASGVFRDCDAISFLANHMIVEFPEDDEESFGERLESLPDNIIGLPFDLQFHNGPLPRTERATQVTRAVKPRLKRLDSRSEFVFDKTNYVASEGKFFPGSMVSAVSEKCDKVESSCATAGVFVQRGHVERLVCSHHPWDGHIKLHPSLVGELTTEAQHVFRLVQGDPGTRVGFLHDRIGITDLGLVQLHPHIKFENILLDSDSSLKSFVHSNNQDIGDRYIFNSFVTGEQRLQRVGRRFKFGVRLPRGQQSTLRVPKGLEQEWPEDTMAYIAYEQGICATNEPVLTRKPFIRGGVCGSVLVRYYDAAQAKQGIKETKEQVLARGECCGMMHFADLQSRQGPGSLGDYIIFADTFDPLIEDGWQVVPVPETEKASKAAAEGEEGEEVGGEEEESPEKKQKLSSGKGKGKGKGGDKGCGKGKGKGKDASQEVEETHEEPQEATPSKKHVLRSS